MKQSEKICGLCQYWGDMRQMCQKDNTFVARVPVDWCGEGWWRKMSDITGKVEDYYFDDDLTYAEQRVVDKKDKTYIVFSYSQLNPIHMYCEAFDNKNHADLYVQDLPEDRLFGVFEASYDSNGNYWTTTEVDE